MFSRSSVRGLPPKDSQSIFLVVISLSQIFRVVGLAWILGCARFGLVAAPARMIYHCTSVKIEPATVKALGDHRLSFNFSNTATENGELVFLEPAIDDPVAGNSLMQGTGFTLTAPGFGVPITGDIYFETPQRDVNHNGVDDIFEVELTQPVAQKKGFLTFRTIDDETVNGTVVAQWERAAGSTRGTLALTIAFTGYTQTFQHLFEIFEYTGSLDYQRVGTNVNAVVNLTRQGAIGTLAGNWSLHVMDADVVLQEGGAWVAGKPGIKFDPSTVIDASARSALTRGGLGTNYFGFLQYSQGSPVDVTPDDYALWQFDIFDPNDADHDRLPDLSDPKFRGESLPAAVPLISIAIEADAPRLRLSGGTNTDYVIEKSDFLFPVVWTPVSTNRPATSGPVDVPLPTKGANGLRFWRARSL